MYEIIVFILILSFLVLIHELGHYLLARKNKIIIKEFGLGYPPRLLKLFTFQGTVFSLNAIPFGGFVKLDGEDGPEDEEKELVDQKKTKLTNQGKKGKSNTWGPFFEKSMSARLQTLLAGVFFNFIFGILVFSLVYIKIGIPQELSNQARIYELNDNSPAKIAGMLPNTNIIALYSDQDEQWVQVSSVAQVQEYVSYHLGENIRVRTTDPCQNTVCPDSYQEFTVYLRPETERPESEGALGVIFTGVIVEHAPWYVAIIKGPYYAVKDALSLSVLILQALGKLIVDLIQGRSVGMDVAGPVGIVQQIQTHGYFDGGFVEIINFAALLSINLAVMNLLPIPALDGGRVFFILLEKLFAKEKIEKVANWANYLGFFILILLMIVVSVNDVLRLFQ